MSNESWEENNSGLNRDGKDPGNLVLVGGRDVRGAGAPLIDMR